MWICCFFLQSWNVQFQKISISPTGGIGIFLGGWGFCKAKKLKEIYEAELEFPEGWGEVWTFSGITQLTLAKVICYKNRGRGGGWQYSLYLMAYTRGSA